MAAEGDDKYMALALELAEKARGKTSPNPMVGAVVVKNGKVIGQGYHKKAGTLHAERIALSDAGKLSGGGVLYVNLEPCCHYGRTEPCTTAIIESGIKRVVYSIKDPNPLVNGKGAAELRRAGIEVKVGVMAKQARRLNETYLKYITTGRPFVILKLAQSIDGRIATFTGESQWITGVECRRLTHRLRSLCDAVVVGAGTVRADNPSLTVRMVTGNNPFRIIVSRHPQFSKSINLYAQNNDHRTILATSSKKAKKIMVKNLTVWSIKENRNGLSLTDLLDKAGKFGITSLLVEGGSSLATSFIREQLVDRYHFMIAPMIIGRGKEAIDDLQVKQIKQAFRLKYYSVRRIGTDIQVIGYPEGK